MVPGNALPSSSAVRRAPTTTARTASDPQRAQRSAGSSRPHHRHTAPDGVAVGQRQRAGAVPAAGDGAAAATGQRGHITPPRHLDQHGKSGLQRRPRGPQRHRRQPGSVRGGVALLRVSAVLECDHPRRAGAHDGTGRHQVVRPPAAHQRLRLGGAGSSRRSLRRNAIGGREASPPRGRAGTARGARPGCRRRRPTPDQAEIGDRSEHRAAGADDQRAPTAQHRQPAPVPLCGAEPRRQRDHPALRRRAGLRWRQQRIHVALVGHDRQHAAAGLRPWRRRLRPAGRPTAPRASACQTARAARPSRSAARNCSPRPYSAQPAVSTGCDGERRGLGGGLLFDVGVPRRDRPAAARRRGCPRSARRRRRRAGARRGSAPARPTRPGPASPACRHGLSPNAFRGRMRRPAGRGSAPAPARRAGRRRTARPATR